jgi:hypothetical protein
MSLTATDESLRPPTADAQLWHDVVAFELHDLVHQLTIDAFIDVQLGVPRLTSSVIVAMDSLTQADRQRVVDDGPQADWDVMGVGGITFRIHEMLTEWLIQLALGDVKAYLVCRALDDGTIIGRALRPESGGYVHTVAVTGDLMIGGHRWVIDATGTREHWWGHQRPSNAVRSLPLRTSR